MRKEEGFGEECGLRENVRLTSTGTVVNRQCVINHLVYMRFDGV